MLIQYTLKNSHLLQRVINEDMQTCRECILPVKIKKKSLFTMATFHSWEQKLD